MDKEIKGFIATHENSELSKLENLKGDNLHKQIKSLKKRQNVEEAFILETCNRVEYYILTSKDTSIEIGEEGFERLNTWKSIEHLIRIACGLESAIIGEDEILGQLKETKRNAKEFGLEGKMLDKAIDKAIQTGKKARKETKINEGKRSIASLAVNKVEELKELEESSVIIIGLGEIGKDILKYLEAENIAVGVKDTSKNRDIENIDLMNVEKALEKLENFDILFSATSSNEYVVENVETSEIVFDLANPRDVDPKILEESRSFNLDDLQNMVDDNLDSRDEEVEKVEEIIEDEIERLKTDYKHMKAESAISTIQGNSHSLKEQKIERLFNKLSKDDVSDDARSEIRNMADSLVNQLMAPPTLSLKRAAETENWETLDTAVKVFGKGKIRENISKNNEDEDVNRKLENQAKH